MILYEGINNRPDSKFASEFIQKVKSFYKVNPRKIVIKSLNEFDKWDNFGEYDFDRDIIYISNNIKTRRTFAITLLHEIRHSLQLQKKFHGNCKKFAEAYEMEMNWLAQMGKSLKNNKYELDAEKWAITEFNRKWRKEI